MIEDVSNLIHFSYTRQKKPLGLGHAVLCAKNLVGREPFAVFLSDDVIDSRVPVMKQMISVFDKYPATILAVQKVPKKDVHKYGIIKAEKVKDRVYRVFDMIEKPLQKDAPSNLAIIGRYILSPEIFEALENTQHGAGGEIQLTDGLRQIVKEQDVYALEFEGTRYDAGDKLGFLMANVSYALKRNDIGGDFKRFLKGLKI